MEPILAALIAFVVAGFASIVAIGRLGRRRRLAPPGVADAVIGPARASPRVSGTLFVLEEDGTLKELEPELARRIETVEAASTEEVAGVVVSFAAATRAEAGRVAVVMQVVISLAMLGFSIYVLASNAYSDSTNNVAAGAIGTILGFWLANRS